MNTKKETNNGITVKTDFPTELINDLQKIFIGTKPKVFKKVLFIVYLINQGTWNKNNNRYNTYYELSPNRLKGYLSLNKQLSPIMKQLVENKIIYVSGIGITGENYTQYSMVKRFDFKKLNSSMSTPVFFTDKDGVYVPRYISDGYIVKYAKSYPKPNNIEQKDEVNTSDEINNKKIMNIIAAVFDFNILNRNNKYV